MISLRRQPGAPGLAAREFVDSTLRGVALETDSTGRIPSHIVEQMRQLGYFGLTVPEEYGGVGLSLVEYLEVVRELARTNTAFQELTEENNGIGSAALLLAGTEQQKKKWLPLLAGGAVLGSFAVTEPGAGSDVAGIQTTARRVPGGYRLNGTKHFITHGDEAGLITVVARLASAEPAQEFGLFLVTPGMDGFQVGRLQPMMGYRASGQAELFFDDVFIPDDAVLGEPGDGFRITMKTLDRGRLTVTADCLGAAEELLDRTIAYAKTRFTFGLPLAARGEIRAMIANSWIELYCIESALFEFAERRDAGEDIRDATARLKLFASEMAFVVADRAMQIHGGLGYTTEAEIERYLRDLRVMRIAEGASEVLRATVARGIHRALNGASPEFAISLTGAGHDSGEEAVHPIDRLLRASASSLQEQAMCDLADQPPLAEVHDARVADQSANWTMINSANRRLAALVERQGQSETTTVAGLGLYVAARRLASDTVEGARLAAVASGSTGSDRGPFDLEALDLEMGTTDQVLDRVADGLLGSAGR